MFGKYGIILIVFVFVSVSVFFVFLSFLFDFLATSHTVLLVFMFPLYLLSFFLVYVLLSLCSQLFLINSEESALDQYSTV